VRLAGLLVVAPDEAAQSPEDGLVDRREQAGALTAPVARGGLRLVDAGHVTSHLRRPDAVFQAIRDLLGSRRG